MPIKYTEKETHDRIIQAMKDWENLYKLEELKWTGTTKDTNKLYTEIIANEILSHVDELRNGIQQITRRGTYKVETHAEIAAQAQPDNSNQDEKWLAKAMYNKKQFRCIGRIIDFETPLSSTLKDNTGEIDLLSYNESEDTVYILELKKPSNPETLLRCVLEAYTYWSIVDGDKLLSDFGYPDAKLRKAVLIYKSCQSYKDFSTGCPETRKLMQELGVDLFVLAEPSGNKIEVTDVTEFHPHEKLINL